MPLTGEKCKKVAKKNHLRIVENGGSHIKIYGPAGRGYMTVYKGELSTGVEHEARKWFKALGILITLAFVIVTIALCLI